MPFLPQARASIGPLCVIGCASGAVESHMKAAPWQRSLIVLTALLALKKKLEEFWGEGDDDTHARNGT